MSRGGQAKDRSDGPERKCIATGEAQPKHGMIRFVVGPDNMIVPDLMEKLPGRGIWVSSDRTALDTAVAKKLFARAAKQPVTLPEDLTGLVETGDAVAGYEKVKDWLSKDYADVLIQASDGSERGKNKLSTPYEGSFIGWLTSNELGLAFGRETVIHAALGTGGLSKRVVEEAARLRGLRA